MTIPALMALPGSDEGPRTRRSAGRRLTAPVRERHMAASWVLVLYWLSAAGITWAAVLLSKGA